MGYASSVIPIPRDLSDLVQYGDNLETWFSFAFLLKIIKIIMKQTGVKQNCLDVDRKRHNKSAFSVDMDVKNYLAGGGRRGKPTHCIYHKHVSQSIFITRPVCLKSSHVRRAVYPSNLQNSTEVINQLCCKVLCIRQTGNKSVCSMSRKDRCSATSEIETRFLIRLVIASVQYSSCNNPSPQIIH